MEGQSISEDYLKKALAERVQAIHVDITDMSGTSVLALRLKDDHVAGPTLHSVAEI